MGKEAEEEPNQSYITTAVEDKKIQWQNKSVTTVTGCKIRIQQQRRAQTAFHESLFDTSQSIYSKSREK